MRFHVGDMLVACDVGFIYEEVPKCGDRAINRVPNESECEC